ncbi:MAG: methylated-DNA--[protein]-cysteine S-methyltransferase [Nitrospirae bacterium]|nr:methylated-DNA--[protein]-cysteine S-methyltransferase [Nitrospirota bacterium]
MGIAASGSGVRAIVLPRASRRTVEAKLLQQAQSGREARAVHLSPTAPRLSPGIESVLQKARTQLVEFLGGTRRELDFPVDLSGGSPFQRRVWRAILRIPYGRVRSYKWVAARVGGKRYARAVGLALGANPVPIVVPCHRVVASARRTGESSGHPASLGGFSGGLWLKRRLLELEDSLPLLRGSRHRS